MLWKTGLIFLCWGLTSGELQDRQSGTPAAPARTILDFGFVPSGVYDTVAYYEPGATGILFNMMHAFLYVVQPNPFPEGELKFLIYVTLCCVQVIYYELGFVVCAALGLLFTVLLPLVGLLFCLCRCCNNCGGEMHQRQRKNADCLRGLLTTLAGVLCAYAANQNLSSQLKSMRRLVKSNLKDLHTFANQTPAQIDYLISKYDTMKQHVLHDLENVGVILGGRIHEELGKDVQPALDAALSMTGTMRDTKDALENVSLTLETLQEGTVKLQANLSLVRGSLSNALNDPVCSDARSSEICLNIRSTLPKLEIAANYSSLPDVTNQLDKVNEVLKTDLGQIVEKGFASFNDTPNLVTDQTRNIVEGVKVLLDDVGSNITTFTKLFPVHSTLTNFTKMISHTHSQIEDIYPQQKVFHVPLTLFIMFSFSGGSVVLPCAVWLCLSSPSIFWVCCVFECNISLQTHQMDLFCTHSHTLPVSLSGVGFSFLFSWVLMGVITALFLAGGNLEKLVCEPFQTRQLFKVLDTPNLVNSAWKNFIPGYLYNDPEMDLTAYSLYSNCKDNRGIYSALHLDKVFNISAFFNTSVVSGSRKFEGMKVDLRGIILLESEGKQNLISFTETGINEIDFAAYLEEVNKGVTRIDLVDFASQLDAQADQLSKGTLQTSLKGHANTIRQIHIQQVIPLEQSMSTLNQSIRLLERTSSDLPVNVLAAVDAAQYLISQNATFVINQETEKYKQTIIGYFKQYIDWIRTSLALEVATCKPLSNIVDTAEILGCSFLLDSVNTFWFGLGCSTLFLLPSIILSVKLAKFYRRMDTEDVYDDDIGNWN
uniref:Prominin-1-A n=1 Tax=Sinocyclocheilus rhinocerous TaxID=307959 RepID=A0A673GTP3_9TELE